MLKNFRVSRFTPLTKALALAFTAVLAFFLIYTCVYRAARSQLIDTTVERTLRYLERGAEDVSARFSLLNAQVAELSSNDSVAELSRGASGIPEPRDYAALLKLKSSLSRLFAPTGCFRELALFFDGAENDMLCASAFILDDFAESWETGVLTGDGDYADFAASLAASSGGMYTRALTRAWRLSTRLKTSTFGDTAFYARRVVVSGQRLKVSALLFIDLPALESALLGAARYGECAYITGILDDGGSDAAAAVAGGRRITYDAASGATLLCVNISDLGATACVRLRDADVLDEISHFTSLWNTLLVAFLALAAALFALLSVYLVYPLQRLAARLKHAPSGEGAAIARIERELNALESDSERLKGDLSRLAPVLKVSLLDKLLRREYLTPEERAALLAMPELGGRWPRRVAIIGNITEERYAMREYSRLAERLIASRLGDALTYPAGRASFAALIPAGGADGEECLMRLRALLDELNALARGRDAFAIGLGRSCDDVEDAPASYSEALEAFGEADTWKRSTVMLYERTALGECRYKLGYDELERLYNLLKSGNSDAARVQLDELAARNFSGDSRNRNRDAYRQFYNDIKGVLVRLSSELDLMPVLNSLVEYDSSPSFEAVLELMRHSFAYAGDLARLRQAATLRDLSRDIKRYINENYSNPDMSLAKLSEVFGMSESSLSKFFKSTLDVNFSSYMEALRLGEAEALLVNTSLPVKDIGARAGYANSTTFYKAFKRKHGLSPSEWALSAKRARLGKAAAGASPRE